MPPGLDWDLWIGPAPMRPYQQRLFPRAEVVSLVGFRQRHDERPRLALERSAVLGAEARRAADHRGERPAAASGDRAGDDERDLRVRRARRDAAGEAHVVSGPDEAAAVDGKGDPAVGRTACSSSATRGCCSPTTASTCCCRRSSSRASCRPPQTIPHSIGHHPEWIHACKTGAPTTCNFGYSGPLTEANHLGNVAYRAGKEARVGRRRRCASRTRRTPSNSCAANIARAGRSGSRLQRAAPGIARSRRFFVMRCTRSSGPCGRDQCDHGSMWPGGLPRPCAQKIVAALKTKLFFGPGKIVAV